MRKALLLFLLLFSLHSFCQDKVYLLNNQLVEGTVTYLSPKLIQVNTKNYDILEYHFDEIAMIVKNGETQVIKHNYKKLNKINKNSWSIGTNILSQLVDAATISIDKRLNKQSSLKVNQIFILGGSNLNNTKLSTLSTLLINGYIEGGQLSFIGSVGFGYSYSEQFYYYNLSPRMENNFNVFFPIGFGLNFDVSRHLSLSAQIFTSLNFDQSYYFRYYQGIIDMFNSGLNIYYKF